MGRKQQVKKERKAKDKKSSAVSSGSSWLGWLIGLLLIMGLAGAAMIMVVNMNKEKLVKFSLVSIVQDIEKELSRNQGKFTINDSKALQNVISGIEKAASDENMDAVIAGQINFMLNVIKEIISHGNLKAGEIEKLQNLLRDTRNRLDINKLNREKKGK